MGALLFHSPFDDPEAWRALFAKEMPDLPVRVWPDKGGDPAEIEFGFIQSLQPGELKKFPNLKAVFSGGAGVDHLLKDPEYPRHVPIVKIVQKQMTFGMTQYVVLQVLRLHRQQPAYQAQQREHVWKELPQPGAWDRTVGIMGLGSLGGASAKALAELGFKLRGWSRTRKRMKDIECFHGASGLEPFLKETEILVCMLPLTTETTGLVNARLLSMLPKGACFINVARGKQHVDADLLAALDSGQLSHVTLDVFFPEPLAADHPYWKHPKVTVTPHKAGNSSREAVIRDTLENIKGFRAGKKLRHTVNMSAGY
jgi:glyoxylate/hydroxypyruvate reductase